MFICARFCQTPSDIRRHIGSSTGRLVNYSKRTTCMSSSAENPFFLPSPQGRTQFFTLFQSLDPFSLKFEVWSLKFLFSLRLPYEVYGSPYGSPFQKCP